MLIVGSGPAGTLLAAQLATFPRIHTRLVERRAGPLELGQADGVACRTVEMFEAFELGDALVARGLLGERDRVLAARHEADRSRIVRTGRVQDVEDGLSRVPARDRQPGAHAASTCSSTMRRSPSPARCPTTAVEFVGLTVGRRRRLPR